MQSFTFKLKCLWLFNINICINSSFLCNVCFFSSSIFCFDKGRGCENTGSSDNIAFYDALAAEDDERCIQDRCASAAALANALPNIHSYNNSSGYESLDSTKTSKVSIEKIVNPLGTVTTVTSCLTADVKTDILDEVVSQLAAEDTVIHENCDESLFRPVVAIFCDEKTFLQSEKEARENNEQYQPPENISNKLVVPVIAKDINDELKKREKQKCSSSSKLPTVVTCTKNKGGVQSDCAVMSTHIKNPKKVEVNDCKKCNLKDDEHLDKNDSQMQKKEHKRHEDLSKYSGISKDIVLKSTKSLSETKSSEEVLKVELGNQNELTNSIKSDKPQIQIAGLQLGDTENITELKIQPNVELKKQSKNKMKVENTEFSKTNDSKDNLKGSETNTNIREKHATPEQHNEENTKITKITKTKLDKTVCESNRMCVNLKNSASIPIKTDRNEINIIKSEGQATLKNTEENLPQPEISKSHSSIKTNTAIKEKVKKSKNNIKINRSDDNKINIISQSNDLAHTDDDIDEIKPNKRENAKITKDQIDDKMCKTTNTFGGDKISSLKSRLNLENEPIDKLLYTKEESEQSSSADQEIKQTNYEKPIEISEKSVNKISEKEGNVNSVQNTNLGNEVFNLQIHKKTTMFDDTDFDKAESSLEMPKTENETILDRKIKRNEQSKAKESNDKEKTINKSEVYNKTNDIHIDKETPVETKKYHEHERREKELKAKEIDKIGENLNNDTIKDEQSRSKLENLNKRNIQIENCADVKSKNNMSKELKTKESARIISETQVHLNEKNYKSNTSSPGSSKNNDNVFQKNEQRNVVDMSKTISCDSSVFNKEFSENENIIKPTKNNSQKKDLDDITLHTCEKLIKDTTKVKLSSQTPPSAWKTLSGAEMINKNLRKSDNSIDYPPLGDVNKPNIIDKLLPELPTPNEMEERKCLDQFSIIKPLDSLPPLPALEPLQLLMESKGNSLREISLINFESPLQENPSLERRIIPTPRGFTEDNLILALCGSLHYEHEHGVISTEAIELSPTFSSNPSSTTLEEPSLADYKSLTENDDPYMSLEQSSQDTNTTTTTNTTNEKFSSSTNSSGSEEVIIMEEKKMTKKQKRKKQQQLKELQKQKEQQKQQEIDDEELRPLIAMTDSQVDNPTNASDESSALALKCDNDQSLAKQTFINSNTTDSDGPMPATTSDDNVCSIPVPIVHNPHKIKTKKLEHKINLIAAIEAATSSSTSSAEESGVELGRRSSHDNDESLISVSSSITSTTPLPDVATAQTAVGVSKKKTKRRKR